MHNNQTPDSNSKIPFSSKYALIVLMVVYCFNFLDRQILVILQEPIKADLGLSDGQLGLMTGFAFAVFYVCAGLPIAYWADRSNRRNIIAIALTVWSGMTAISGFASNYIQLLLARIGVGVGEAGGSPPAHAMISDYFPKKKRTTALSIYSSGLYIGIMAGYLLGGYLGENYSWRTAFFVVGLPGIALALLVRYTIREPQRGYWDGVDANEVKPTLKQTLRVLSGIPVFWMMSVAAGLTAMVSYGVGNFTPSYLMRNHGMGLAEVGVYLAFIYGISGILGTTISGLLADKLSSKGDHWYLGVPAIGTVLSVPFNLIAYSGDNLVLIMVCVFMFHTLYCMFLTPTISVAHTLVSPSMRALASSILFFVLNMLGKGIGPPAVGFLSDYYASSLDMGVDSLRYAQLTLSVFGVPAALLFLIAGMKLKSVSHVNSDEESPTTAGVSVS